MQSSERSERENFGGIEKKYHIMKYWAQKWGFVYAPLDQILWDASTRHPRMLWGGGVGTLLQNLWKTIFKQKKIFFYLLKIFGAHGHDATVVRCKLSNRGVWGGAPA